MRFRPPSRCVAAPCCWLRAVIALLLVVVAAAAAAATGITRGGGGRTSSSNNNNGENPKEQKIRVHDMAVDPFVRSSPMIAAMVCNDGIALVATHIDEPLQFDLVVKSTTSTIESDDDNDAALLRLLLDAPCPSYNQRIMALTGGGRESSTKAAVLMTAGWRADGHGRLLNGARSILARNVDLFGTERIETLPYDLSQFLTTCAGSESVRHSKNARRRMKQKDTYPYCIFSFVCDTLHSASPAQLRGSLGSVGRRDRPTLSLVGRRNGRHGCTGPVPRWRLPGYDDNDNHR
jgi:hypothetical protein